VLINDPIKIVNELGLNRVGSGSSLKSSRSKGKSGELKRVISREKIKELVQTVQVFEMIKKPQQSNLK